MPRVLKYSLKLENTLLLPQWSKPLCVAWQRGDVCMWVQVPDEGEQTPRYFYVNPTGAPIEGHTYIGSAVSDSLVFHVYEGVAREKC